MSIRIPEQLGPASKWAHAGRNYQVIDTIEKERYFEVDVEKGFVIRSEDESGHKALLVVYDLQYGILSMQSGPHHYLLRTLPGLGAAPCAHPAVAAPLSPQRPQ